MDGCADRLADRNGRRCADDSSARAVKSVLCFRTPHAGAELATAGGWVNHYEEKLGCSATRRTRRDVEVGRGMQSRVPGAWPKGSAGVHRIDAKTGTAGSCR